MAMQNVEYEKTQENYKIKSHSFIKHISSRWLTYPAAVQLFEQWNSLYYYFLKHVVKQNTTISMVAKENLYNSKTFSNKIKIMFCNWFGKNVLNFVSTESLMHVLYDKLQSFFATILGSIYKPSVLKHDFMSREFFSKEI